MKKYIENIISRNLIDNIDNLHKEKYNDISFSFDFDLFSEYHIYLNKKSRTSNKLRLSKNFYIYYSCDFLQYKVKKNKKLIYYLMLLSIYKYLNYQGNKK